MNEEIDELYERYKLAYELFGIKEDEDFDDMQIKKIYRIKSKIFHPDNLKTGDAKKFKALSLAYELLKNKEGREQYRQIKETKKEANFSNKEKKSYKYSKKSKKEEKTNQYIFQRRDGSKIEIQPLGKINIEGKSIYYFNIIQYYSDITYINDMYARINWRELMNNVEYCDFCVNSFFSKSRIETACKGYNGYLGHVEGAKLAGRNIYRNSDYNSNDVYDIFIEIGQMDSEKAEFITIDPDTDKAFEPIQDDDIDLLIEKTGTVIISGKKINQYNVYSDNIDINDLIYGNIDIKKMQRCPEYKVLVCREFLNKNRLIEKLNTDRYVGSFLYDPIEDDYSIDINYNIQEVLRKRNKNREK